MIRGQGNRLRNQNRRKASVGAVLSRLPQGASWLDFFGAFAGVSLRAADSRPYGKRQHFVLKHLRFICYINENGESSFLRSDITEAFHSCVCLHETVYRIAISDCPGEFPSTHARMNKNEAVGLTPWRRSGGLSARKTCPWAGFQRRPDRKAPGDHVGGASSVFLRCICITVFKHDSSYFFHSCVSPASILSVYLLKLPTPKSAAVPPVASPSA